MSTGRKLAPRLERRRLFEWTLRDKSRSYRRSCGFQPAEALLPNAQEVLA